MGKEIMAQTPVSMSTKGNLFTFIEKFIARANILMKNTNTVLSKRYEEWFVVYTQSIPKTMQELKINIHLLA
jgi:hypothetical protein